MNRHITQMLQKQSTPQGMMGYPREMEFCVQREQAQMKWQQEQLHQQQQLSYMINDNNQMSMFNLPIQGGISKQEDTMGSGWNVYGVGDINCTLPRTVSCPPAVAEAIAEAARTRSKEGCFMTNLSSAVGKESIMKRKLDRTQSLKVKVEEETKDKMKGCIHDAGSKITENQSNSNNGNKEPSPDASEENSKVSEGKKLDYIHVRARRGQATDSHSLAERVRREKISERMKFLQDLVPGCNKIIGKAGMLDEIINYVQSLQRQVEFLSMKLATVNPTIDYNIENLLNEEVPQASTNEFSTIAIPSEMVNPLQDLCSGPETNVSHDMELRRTISAPVSLPETVLNQSYINHASPWDADLENLYVMEFQQGKYSSFTQPFTGHMEATQVKLEM
ncbi:hypothetical protein Leryth_004358 [Lithospermum erythrorhizon]|nr:hypothetical protein Leryth_004358 [Lithospermum erythrorhizon]